VAALLDLRTRPLACRTQSTSTSRNATDQENDMNTTARYTRPTNIGLEALPTPRRDHRRARYGDGCTCVCTSNTTTKRRQLTPIRDGAEGIVD
jgi:hypothetical protein